MFYFSALIVTLMCSFISSNYLSPEVISLFKNTTESITIDLKDESILCAAKKCIPKCCPKGQYMIEVERYSYSCVPYEKDLQFHNVSIYDNYYYDQKLDLKFRDIFLLVPNKFADENFTNNAPIVFTKPEIGMRNHLTVDGILIAELPNAYKRWTKIDRDQFCLDFDLNSTTPEPNFWAVMPNEPIADSSFFYRIGLLISSFFLLAVLVIYCILPDLQNLVGKVLMAYVFSLLSAFLSLATMQIGNFQYNECIILSAVIYVSILSSFCWMNVMSYDIWWTFRGYAKARPIHRRGENFKFMMYCLYAWGVPVAMTIALVVINSMDLNHMPWFITPQIPKLGCLISGGQKFVYLYIPMLILIICNWMFFFLTVFNIWRLNRSTAILDRAAAGTPAAHRSQKNRFMVYLKVSFIMGINWILEVVSSLKPELNIWYLSDTYNSLMGLGIFLIFIFNMKTLRKLRERFSGFKGFKLPQRYLTKSHTASTIESNLSQDSQSVPLQVSSHPQGFGQREVKSYNITVKPAR